MNELRLSDNQTTNDANAKLRNNDNSRRSICSSIVARTTTETNNTTVSIETNRMIQQDYNGRLIVDFIFNLTTKIVPNFPLQSIQTTHIVTLTDWPNDWLEVWVVSRVDQRTSRRPGLAARVQLQPAGLGTTPARPLACTRAVKKTLAGRQPTVQYTNDACQTRPVIRIDRASATQIQAAKCGK